MNLNILILKIYILILQILIDFLVIIMDYFDLLCRCLNIFLNMFYFLDMLCFSNKFVTIDGFIFMMISNLVVNFLFFISICFMHHIYFFRRWFWRMFLVDNRRWSYRSRNLHLHYFCYLFVANPQRLEIFTRIFLFQSNFL